MANFHEALRKIVENQSGYSENLDDASGEKYNGISRRFYPSWGGWEIVDALGRAASNENELKKTLEQNERLKQEVRFFFKQIYWDRFWGDRIPDQEIAEELLDTSLNLGVHGAVCLLQESLNLLSENGKKYRDILQDGRFGPNTLQALEAYLTIEDSSYLLKMTNVLQGMKYIEYLRRSPGQESYVKKWFKKIQISKNLGGVRPPAPPTDFRIE